MSVYFKDFFNSIFDPNVRASFLGGFVAGGALTFWATAWLTKETKEALRAKDSLLTQQLSNKTKELDELKNDFSNKNSEWAKKNTDYESEIKDIKERLTTIRCSICGASVRKTGQKQSRHHNNEFDIALQCTNADCGHTMELNSDEIARINLK